MVSSSDTVLQGQTVADGDDERERWPLLYSALLALGASGLLWGMIVGAVRWLFG